MRELKEIFGTVSDMKSGKEIEKRYQNLVSTYQAFYKKAKQMQEEAALEELYAKWEELSLQKDC